MTTVDRQKLLDRIRKLHAKAESAKAIGSEHEAATFAAAVAKMLTKYKLEMSDLEFSQIEQTEPIGDHIVFGAGKKTRQLWAETLAQVVADAHFCKIMVMRGSDAIWLVGRETDRKVAEFVFITLRRTAEELSDKEARSFRKKQRAQYGATLGFDQNFRAAWLNGFITRIAERYREEQRAQQEQARSTGMSLIRLDQSREAVEKHLDKQKARPAKRLRGKQSANIEGHIRGRTAGSNVSIRGTGLGEGTSSRQGQLGSGQ